MTGSYIQNAKATIDDPIRTNMPMIHHASPIPVIRCRLWFGQSRGLRQPDLGCRRGGFHPLRRPCRAEQQRGRWRPPCNAPDRWRCGAVRWFQWACSYRPPRRGAGTNRKPGCLIVSCSFNGRAAIRLLAARWLQLTLLAIDQPLFQIVDGMPGAIPGKQYAGFIRHVRFLAERLEFVALRFRHHRLWGLAIRPSLSRACRRSSSTLQPS